MSGAHPEPVQKRFKDSLELTAQLRLLAVARDLQASFADRRK
jgi:hypothetical protein